MNVVTKSGTNEVHGDLYEFFRNNVLNDRGYFDPSLPDYKQNQFGGTLGRADQEGQDFHFRFVRRESAGSGKFVRER